VDIERVVRRAEEHGVRVRALSGFYLGTPTHAGLMIGYGAIPTSRVNEGLTRLAASFGR
jgi:GntR family transcriptional regulator/MocR family aminotransferase